MPGWERAAGERLDALIERSVPGVQKAVRWNSPFYGVEGKGWFVSFHCFTRYIKITFFKGAALDPLPPVGSKDPDTRYLNIHEDEDVDGKRPASWLKQEGRSGERRVGTEGGRTGSYRGATDVQKQKK